MPEESNFPQKKILSEKKEPAKQVLCLKSIISSLGMMNAVTSDGMFIFPKAMKKFLFKNLLMIGNSEETRC